MAAPRERIATFGTPNRRLVDAELLCRTMQRRDERILRDLAVLYGFAILPLDGFHLIFEPQFKFL